MACKEYSSSEKTATILKPIYAEILTTIDILLKYPQNKHSNMYIKQFTTPGSLLILHKNRKNLEEQSFKLLVTSTNQDINNNADIYEENSNCVLCTFSEESIKQLNIIINGQIESEVLSIKYIRKVEIQYSTKMCGLLCHVDQKSIMQNSFLHILMHSEDINLASVNDAASYIILDMSYLEEFLMSNEDYNITSILNQNINLTDINSSEASSDQIRSRLLANSIHTCSKVKLITSKNWCNILNSKDQLKCKYDNIMKSFNNNAYKIEAENTRECKLNAEKYLDANLVRILDGRKSIKSIKEIPIIKNTGLYSRELTIAVITMIELEAFLAKNTTFSLIIILASRKINDLVVRMIIILTILKLVDSSIWWKLILHSNWQNKLNKELIQERKSEREKHLHNILISRINDDDVILNSALITKAKLMAEATLHFDILSTSLNQPVKLEVSDKIGSHKCVFILYNYARICQIIRKHQTLVNQGKYPPLPTLENIDFNLLQLNSEWALFVDYILLFPQLINQMLDLRIDNGICTNKNTLCVSTICTFVSNVAHDFSRYYSKTRILLEGSPILYPKVAARIYLITCLKEVIKWCLNVLKIEAFEEL